MDWTQTVFEVIDMRSFSNLWYWIALAVFWSTASHWVLGVPFDLIQRAARQGGQAEIDLQDLVRINVNRLLYIGRGAGFWLLGFISFLHTVLIVLGWWYDVEFAQALALIGVPMSFVGALSLWTSSKIERAEPEGELLRKMLMRHRVMTQVIGMLSIFVTAMWGMYQNLAAMPGF